MCALSPAFGGVTHLPAIVVGRRLFGRERDDGLYLSVTYVVWKVLEEAILALLSAAIFTCTVVREGGKGATNGG